MAKSHIQIDLNLPNIKINLQKQLFEIANKDIVPDLQTRMTGGIDIDGNPHPQNKASTRVYKALRGLKTEPLLASGQLRKSFKVAALSKASVEIFPAGARRPYPSIKSKYRIKKKRKSSGSNMTVKDNFALARILQEQGVRGGHKYNFIGVSVRAEKRAFERMKDFVEKAINIGADRVRYNG